MATARDLTVDSPRALEAANRTMTLAPCLLTDQTLDGQDAVEQWINNRALFPEIS